MMPFSRFTVYLRKPLVSSMHAQPDNKSVPQMHRLKLDAGMRTQIQQNM